MFTDVSWRFSVGMQALRKCFYFGHKDVQSQPYVVYIRSPLLDVEQLGEEDPPLVKLLTLLVLLRQNLKDLLLAAPGHQCRPEPTVVLWPPVLGLIYLSHLSGNLLLILKMIGIIDQYRGREDHSFLRIEAVLSFIVHLYIWSIFPVRRSNSYYSYSPGALYPLVPIPPPTLFTDALIYIS